MVFFNLIFLKNKPISRKNFFLEFTKNFGTPIGTAQYWIKAQNKINDSFKKELKEPGYK